MSNKESLKELDQLPHDQRQALLEANWLNLRSQLYRSVFNWTRDKEQTEEILAETFLQFFRHLGNVNPTQVKNLNAYLTAIARKVLHQRDVIAGSSKMDERNATEGTHSDQHNQSRVSGQRTLSQRLYGVLTFDGAPPNDEEVKDLIADYLIRKYS